MIFSLFKTPSHRVFHYEPRFYDERAERREEVAEEAQREKALREGKEWKDERYIPGKHIRGKIRAAQENNRRHDMSKMTQRVISLITIVILFVVLVYFADYFRLFLESIR